VSAYKAITLRLPAAQHKRIAFAMLRRDVPSLQVLMTDLLAAWLDVMEEGDALEGYQSLPDMVQGIHLKWIADPSSVSEAWAKHFSEMEAAVGVIALKSQKHAELQSVSGESAFTVELVPGFSAVSRSAKTVSIEEDAAANWQEILRRIFASGHSVAINAITHNLDAFYELAVRPKGTNNGSSEDVHPQTAKERRGKTSTRHKNRKTA
jgi:hypothetical protein